MGKKKQAQRTKNNVVPASSGRSAELLQSNSSVTFVGFNTLKEGGYIPILSGVSDELDTNINEDFRLVWKKMNKKDTTTKLKALDEFKKLCHSCDVEVLKPVLPFWPRLFCTLSTDEEHRVREAAHTAHRALVTKAGRNIAPYLKQLVGPWFTGQHDTYPPAASAAESAFQETFPPNKLVEAIVFCQDEILNYICNNLLEQTPQTLANNLNNSQEEKLARYQRVIISCLNGYALYLQRLPVEHLRKAEEANSKLVTSAKFWKFSKDPNANVRAAWFTALVVLCEKAAFLLINESKHVCMAVFSNLDETDPSVVHTIWQAVLLTFHVVQDVWTHVSLEKMVLPKLWKVLKEGADGNASLVFPNLLPLLSKIPNSIMNDKSSFYSKFFENLRVGLKVRSVQISSKETAAVVSAFLECLRYVVSISEDMALCQTLFESQVFPLLETVMTEPKLQLARPCLFSGLASLVNTWCRPPTPATSATPEVPSLFTSLNTSFWLRLTQFCEEFLVSSIVDAARLYNNCTAVEALLVALKQPDSHPKRSFRVKFISPRKSKDGQEEEEGGKVEEDVEGKRSVKEKPEVYPLFEQHRNRFVESHLSVCVTLLQDCGERAKVVLVGHLARTVEEYSSADVFRLVLRLTGLDWPNLYRQKLALWLRDDSVPLDCTLRLIFSLLQYVENEEAAQNVYADLSGEKWQEVLEWGLRHQGEQPLARQWMISHGGICRLVTLLQQNHPSYNVLHNCLRNLRHNAWLTTETLGKLISNLRRNLIDNSVSADVKSCSGQLLYAMLQNTANHGMLVQLSTEDLTSLLYELFTGALLGLDHFPSSQCWQNCVAVLALKTGANLAFSATCETCVDLLLATIRTRPIDIAESEHLSVVLEQLIMAASTVAPKQTVAMLTTVVLSRLSACLRGSCEDVWRLYGLTEFVHGSLQDLSLCRRQLQSHVARDPLASISLVQYVTGMIPFLTMVVRLHTIESEEEQFPYLQLRSTLAAEDLWQWTIEILQLQTICLAIQHNFSQTKQYLLLKEKIMFILEECGLLSQVKVRDLIGHLRVSMLKEENNSLLQCDSLRKLQTEAVVKDLPILYGIRHMQRELSHHKSVSLVKHHFFPEDSLKDISKSATLERSQLSTVNWCCRRLTALKSIHIPITVLDTVFDLYVAEEKENRSLLHLSEEELRHVAEVADFAQLSVRHFSAHMKQSSWDACLVATAALTLSVSTTLAEWRQLRIQSDEGTPTTSLSNEHAEPTEISATTSSSTEWPLSLLTQNCDVAEKEETEFIKLPIVRVVCAVCRLFDAVSAHMLGVDPEDKAGVTRRAEWSDVFLSTSHAAIAQAWRFVAEAGCDRPTAIMLCEALSSSVRCYVEYPHFTDGDTLSCLDNCCRLLQSSETSVQLAAYQLLLQLIPAMVQLDLKESEQDNIALSCQHMDQTLLYTQSIAEVILSGLKFGDMCIVEPFTDSYSYTLCYLLLWSALLQLCANACSELRALYTTWLKEAYLPVFMKTVFCLMPEVALHGDVPSQRIARFFSNPPQFDKGLWNSDRLSQMSCWVFAQSLRRLPAAIRQWWNEADHRVYNLVETLTANYVSPDLCLEEMRAIQTHEKKFENMTVHVLPSAKEVYAVYTVEESRMELVIELAHNHPLGLVKVKSGQRMVSTTQTRQWLLQITMFLTHQNGSIWDALELWKTSLDKRFEGVEECYICFAILHSASHQLPKLSCQTCRKKFHSHCLYKWFTTSHKSTCPICRNLF